MHSLAKKLTVVVVALSLSVLSLQSAEAAITGVPDEGMNRCPLHYSVPLVQTDNEGDTNLLCTAPMSMHSSPAHSCCSGICHAYIPAMVFELIPAITPLSTIRLSLASEMAANGFLSPPFRPPIG